METSTRQAPGAGESAPLQLSLIVPAYNEEDSVAPLLQAIMAHVPRLGRTFEVVFVDDGSRDGTFARISRLAAEDRRVRVVKLRRNYGQTPAIVAGIDHARGDILVTLDADLQNDPKDIGRLLRKLDEGYDLVVGWRQRRRDRWLSRKLPSLLANMLIAWVTGVQVRDNGCTLKAFRAVMIRSVPLYGEMHRFIPAMTSTTGCRLAEIPVDHHPRRFGRSKYGLSRIYKVGLDLMAINALLLFSARPLFCFLGSATLAGLMAFGALAWGLELVAWGEVDAVVVPMGVALLFGSLAIFLGLAGLIVSLAYQTFLEPAGKEAMP